MIRTALLAAASVLAMTSAAHAQDGEARAGFGGAFLLFVPNIAESVSKGLSGAVYGIMMILLIYVMPSGASGFVKAVVARLKK